MGDPDEQFLTGGLRHGFYITRKSATISPASVANYRSATGPENCARVEAQLKQELALGRYRVCDSKPELISAIGAIPKPDSDDLRIIQDFSRPLGKSVNSYADPESHKFVTVDNAAKLVKPGNFMCKVDLRQAYRHVALNPSQYKFTGLKWHFAGTSEPTYMYDTCLPFGASESVGCFHRITQSVVRMLQRRVKCSVLCYIDDFIIISDSYEQCRQSQNILIHLLCDLGFSISWNKCTGPSQELCFLGIMLNSVSMSMSIPQQKLQDIRSFVASWANKSKATKRELQSLIGKRSWTAKCIRAIRPVLRSLIDLQKGLRKPSHRIRLSNQVKSDICYYHQWCVQFNGVVMIPQQVQPQPDTTVFTDASLAAGAAYCGSDFLFSNWSADSPQIHPESIYVKELCAILLAYRRWCYRWKDKTVHLYTDNTGAEWALRKGLTRNVAANSILREILWISAYFNISSKVHHIASNNNCVADALSRMNSFVYLLFAARLLSNEGVHILEPSYNMLNNMSLDSYTSLFSYAG